MTYTYPELTDTPDLTESDAMAFGFLSRAAEAIRAVPSLIGKLDNVEASLKWVAEERDTLLERTNAQADEISTLRSQLQSMIDAEAQARRDFVEMRDLRDARQRDIDVLDETVANLNHNMTLTAEALNDARAKSALQAEALNKVVDQINGINRILGKPDLDPDPREEIEAACAASPSGGEPLVIVDLSQDDEPIRDGLDSPTYRREVADDSTRVDCHFATRGEGDQMDVIDLHS